MRTTSERAVTHMPRNSRTVVLGLAALLIMTKVAGASEVLVGTGEFPPFVTKNTADQGCVIEIVRSAYEAEGWTVKLRFLPWSRNLKELSRGYIDASAYWMDRPDRREDYIFPENPVTSEVYRFVFRKDSAVEWDSYEDLSGKTIILNKDYTYTDTFQKALGNYGIKSQAVKSEDLNLKMILKGRGDLTIMSEGVFQQYFDELSDDQQALLTIDTKPALTNQGYLVFSRENAEKSEHLAKVFDDGYEKIKERADLRKQFEICGL
jgi:polar amino acid transport system substrate-binding protein